jgi:hypothetical protein
MEEAVFAGCLQISASYILDSAPDKPLVRRSNAWLRRAIGPRLKGDDQVMADTGENRQIIGRANAKEAETVRASRKMVSEERSTARASTAAFGGTDKGSRRRTKGSQRRSLDPRRIGESTG